VLCFHTSAEKEFPMIRSLRGLGFSCATAREEEKYTKQRVRWIFEQLIEDPPDIFVINAVYPAAYYAGRWLRQAGIPTVGICHGGGMMPFYSGLLDEFVFGEEDYKVSAFVCVSKWLERDVRVRQPKGILLQSIPCGVPIPEKVAKKPGRLKIAYVGRLVEEQKRISEVARGLCQAVREVPGTEALIYGDGPARGAVEQILREEGNALPVQLVGYVESNQISRLLSECHAVVLLSDHEGLGLSLLEGMACGVVPIALRGASGVSEFVEDGVTGMLVGDRGKDFVAAVGRLREDPALWQRLAGSARAKVEAEYSEKVCVDRWLELFRQLLDGRGPRQPLRTPRWLGLPPVHPALASLDRRRGREIIQRARRFASRVKHQYLPTLLGG
jgi:glycosyltransferase involved in cell wall biosynthesis